MPTDHFSRTRGAAQRERPPDDAVLADLVDFHTAEPGITEATLGSLRTPDGRTSYEVLVEHLPDSARSVLDLGCGNGPLLDVLARRATLERVVGVDACAPEIARAVERLAHDHRVAPRCARGDATGLEDASMDAVLSHHAFYLMTPVEPVVAEIARVLRPGGPFAFATTSPRSHEHATWTELLAAFGPLTKRDNPHFTGWGDPRVFREDGLRALFTDTRRFGEPEIALGHLMLEGPVDAIVETLARFLYSAFLQRDETRAELRTAWRRILERATEPATFPFAVVTFRRRDD